MTNQTCSPRDNSENGTCCPYCGSSNINDSSSVGELCGDCGTVISEHQSNPTEQNLQNHGHTASGSENWSDHYTVQNSTEQQVANAFAVLEKIGDDLKVNKNTRRTAATLYGEIAARNLTDGRPTEAIIGATLVLGARQSNTAVPLGRVADAADITESTLYQSVRLLGKELEDTRTGSKPADYLPFLCSELTLGEQVDSEARIIISALEDNESIAGKHPVGIASAALYLAADGTVTQRAIANVAGVTTETIRVRVRDCREVLSNT